jgi:hypothetical protein
MTYTDVKHSALETLRQGGIMNPARLVKLIQDAIAFLKLDLSGLTVLTEAASGAYVVTPVVASLAGANCVLALTRDSRYASAEAVIAQTRALESLCGVEGRVEIYTQHSLDLFAQGDIVTNLGFVRPIDAMAIAAMKPTAVIPLMCEAWEFRPGDVDLQACRNRGIPVVGTNEDYPGLEVFAYSGWLCLKMLFEAQIEVHKSKIILVSSDKFGRVIERQFLGSGVSVQLFRTLRDVPQQILAEADALVIADYTRTDLIIGQEGDISALELAQVAPSLTVVQFAGRVDTGGLIQNGLFVYPGYGTEARRMAKTLAVLGPRPVVELHVAGLKVAERAAKCRLQGRSNTFPDSQGVLCDLAQKL